MAAVIDERWDRAGPPDTTDGDAPDDDRLLVARACHDRAAFAPLYRRYLPDVYRYCLFRLGDREAAEDVTSQVFIRALDRLGQYRGGSFRAWLVTIAHRATIDDLRARRPAVPIDGIADLHSREPAPETLALAGDETRRLLTLLARLPDGYRQVVELRLTGLNDREIADVLGEGHTAIRTRQSRAMARLRTLAAEDGWLAAREDER